MKRLAIILSVVALAIAAVLVSSCKKDPKQYTPEEVVKAAYDAYVAKDFETFFSYYNMPDDQRQAWIELMNEKCKSEDFNGIVDFSIKGSEINGDTATVTIWSKFADGTIQESPEQLVKTADGWKLKWIEK